MRDNETIEFELGTWGCVVAVIAIFVLGMLLGASLALADEVPADHTAFGLTHQIKTTLDVTVPVPENATEKQVAAAIKKVEDRAIAILRRPDSGGLTLQEAQAKVRVNGRTDVRRCIEIILDYQMRTITQVRVTGHRQEAEHPEVTQ